MKSTLQSKKEKVAWWDITDILHPRIKLFLQPKYFSDFFQSKFYSYQTLIYANDPRECHNNSEHFNLLFAKITNSFHKCSLNLKYMLDTTSR